MTHLQASILKAIHAAVSTSGVSPTYEELCTATGVRSRGHMHKAVAALVASGYVRRGLGQRRRSLEIIRLPTAMGGVCPTCGRASA